MTIFQNDPFGDFDEVLGRRRGRSGTSGAIPMDAYRRGSEVWVHLDLPGVDVDSIDISLERNVLTVTASRTWEVLDDDQIYINERRTGTFTRQVHLGDGLDAGAIEAQYDDGVLSLKIPVAEKAQSRKIAVRQRGEQS